MISIYDSIDKMSNYLVIFRWMHMITDAIANRPDEEGNFKFKYRIISNIDNPTGTYNILILQFELN